MIKPLDEKARKERKQLIEHMLDQVEAALHDQNRTNPFIEKMREIFDEWGSLADGQIEGIRKFYERI